MAAGLHQRPGAHVRAADAQHHHAIHLLGQAVAGGEDAIQKRPLFAKQPLGQVEERGIQRLPLQRDQCASFILRQIVEQFLPGGRQPRPEPLQVGLDQAGLLDAFRSIVRGDERRMVVTDGRKWFHDLPPVEGRQRDYPDLFVSKNGTVHLARRLHHDNAVDTKFRTGPAGHAAARNGVAKST